MPFPHAASGAAAEDEEEGVTEALLVRGSDADGLALGRRERDGEREAEEVTLDVGQTLCVPDCEPLPLPLSDADALPVELALAEGLAEAEVLPETESDAEAAHVTLRAPRRAPGTPASRTAASGPAPPAPHATAAVATP